MGAVAVGWLIFAWVVLFSWSELIGAGHWLTKSLLSAITFSTVLTAFSKLSAATRPTGSRLKLGWVVTALTVVSLLWILSLFRP